jgi:hypothetical protein
MEDDVFEAYHSSKKKEFYDLIKAEKKVKRDRIEKDKTDKKERKRIEEENAKLKAEKEASEKQAQAEQKDRDKADFELRLKKENEREERTIEAVNFLLDNNFKECEGGHESKNYHHFIGSNHYNDFERDSELDIFKTDVIKYKKEAEASNEIARLQQIANAKHEAELKIQRDKAEKLESEKLANQKALEDAAKSLEARLQAELNKGDADKVKDLINDLTFLKTKYTFKSKTNHKMFVSVCDYLDKLLNFISK